MPDEQVLVVHNLSGLPTPARSQTPRPYSRRSSRTRARPSLRPAARGGSRFRPGERNLAPQVAPPASDHLFWRGVPRPLHPPARTFETPRSRQPRQSRVSPVRRARPLPAPDPNTNVGTFLALPARKSSPAWSRRNLSTLSRDPQLGVRPRGQHPWRRCLSAPCRPPANTNMPGVRDRPVPRN